MSLKKIALLASLVSASGSASSFAAGPQMLIFSGGKTQAEAETGLANLQKSKFKLSAIAFAAGFPKILESKDFEGLKPGFWIVSLGICEKSAAKILKVFKKLSPDAYP